MPDMTGSPNDLTESPSPVASEALDEILSAMHLSGGVFIESDFRGRWAIVTRFLPELCSQFFPITGSLIGYHYVREGSVWAAIDGEAPQLAPAGSLIVLPRNDPHRLFTSEEVEVIPADTLLDLSDSRVARIRLGEEGEPTRLFCGFLTTTDRETPVLDQLPALLVVQPANELHGEWLNSSLTFAASGNPLPPVEVGRLAELLVRATLRAHLQALATEANSWISGLRDLYVSRTLSLIHQHFAEEIDMSWLSREAGISRSALHERFVGLIGEPPMRYCTRWRLRQAADRLRDSGDNTASIAFAVGYHSEAAFNRAFKREFGEPPATWRKREQARIRGVEPAIEPHLATMVQPEGSRRL